MGKILAAGVALMVAGAVLAGTTGCAGIAKSILYGTSTPNPKSNYELQRESALRFRAVWANVERIRFTSEGNKPAFGASWSASAVATVSGNDYEVIIGTVSLRFPLGDSPPKMRDLPPSAARVVLTVIYSDGTVEEIE